MVTGYLAAPGYRVVDLEYWSSINTRGVVLCPLRASGSGPDVPPRVRHLHPAMDNSRVKDCTSKRMKLHHWSSTVEEWGFTTHPNGLQFWRGHFRWAYASSQSTRSWVDTGYKPYSVDGGCRRQGPKTSVGWAMCPCWSVAARPSLAAPGQ